MFKLKMTDAKLLKDMITSISILVDEATFNNLEKLTMESTLEIGGEVREDQRAPGGRELSVNKVGNVIEADLEPLNTTLRRVERFWIDQVRFRL